MNKNTRKIFLLCMPMFVIVFIVVIGVLVFAFNAGPATPVPAGEQAVIVTPVEGDAVIVVEEPVTATEDAAEATDEVPAAPTVTYENQE